MTRIELTMTATRMTHQLATTVSSWRHQPHTSRDKEEPHVVRQSAGRGVDLMHLDELQLQRKEEKEHPEDATRYKSPHQVGEEFAYPVEEEDEEYLDKCLHKQS